MLTGTVIYAVTTGCWGIGLYGILGTAIDPGDILFMNLDVPSTW